MSCVYTERETLEKIQKLYEEKQTEKMYQELTWTGTTKDGERRDYEEIWAKYILEHQILPGDIQFINPPSEKEYCKYERLGGKTGNGKEEKIQRGFYEERMHAPAEFGKCIWFEMNLNRNGKGVDLVFYNEKTRELSIVELKYKSKENLLRAVLELQTYYQKTNWAYALDALRDRAKERGCSMATEVTIKKRILLLKTGDQYAHYVAISKKTDSYLKKLIDSFGIEVSSYEE